MIRTLMILAVVAIPGIAPAAAGEYPTLADKVVGHPDARYFDLIRQVVTDLTMDADGNGAGTTMTPLRHIDGSNGGVPEQIRTSFLDAAPFRVDGRTMTLVLIGLGQSQDSIAETALLALYDEQLTLIDAVDVGLYENNWWSGVFPISESNDAVHISSEHFNSQQAYDAAELVYVNEGRLTLIDTIYTFSVQAGVYDEKQVLTVESPQAGGGNWPIIASVHATRTLGSEEPVEEGEEREPLDPPYDRKISVTYNWSASLGGYVADSDAFRKLAEENEQKF